MIKAVIDTNIFISAVFWEGVPKKIVSSALSKSFVGITSKEILQELEGKLLNKFHFPQEQTQNYVQLLLQSFELVQPAVKVKVVEDASDNKIIEAAIEAKANYIVTSDRHLLKIKKYLRIEILAPVEFLQKIGL